MKIDIVTLSKKWNGIHVRKGLIEKAISKYCHSGESRNPHDFIKTQGIPGQARDDNSFITVALSTDAHIQQLNNNFRAKDKPTNVLSFPNHAHNGGDIILAIETIKREAKAEDKPLRDHLEHLIVHGVLHCFGYDHEDDNDWDKMVKMEVKICAELGFHPYPE